ncbi:MAG: universal stress protein [Promethearchaeota archaeon]
MNNENQISLQKILVPIDGSHASLHAQEVVVPLARSFDSKVKILHVVPRGLLKANVSPTFKGNLQSILEQKGRKIVGDAHSLYVEEGIPLETEIIEYGDPADFILNLCGQYDLTVLGGRGEGPTKEFALGSVAEKVIRHNKCPTLVVKKRKLLSKILVIVDDSDSSKTALHYAIELAKIQKGELTLLNAVRRLPLALKEESAKKNSKDILEESSKIVEAQGLTAKARTALGPPAQVITTIADEEDCSLVVMGRRSRRGIKRFMSGGVSEKVVHNAKTSVMVV